MVELQLADDRQPEASVEQERVEKIYSEGATHRFAYLRVKNLDPNDPEVAIEPWHVGLSRLVAMSVEAVGTPFRVAWNGDPHDPALRFDEWPETPEGILVQCEAWGT